MRCVPRTSFWVDQLHLHHREIFLLNAATQSGKVTSLNEARNVETSGTQRSISIKENELLLLDFNQTTKLMENRLWRSQECQKKIDFVISADPIISYNDNNA